MPFQLIANCPSESEFDEIRDPLGHVFRLSDGRRRFLLSEAGTGLPPFHYVTQATPFQHGATVIDFFARPRVVTQRYRWPAAHRNEWWALRTVMADAVRPNRQFGGATRTAALTLRKYLPDGSALDLRVMIDRSPNFAQRERPGWDEWALDEVLRFIAHDPIYFDPVETVVSSDLADDQLVFSDRVPGFVGGVDFQPRERIYFGGGREVSVLYTGTWLAWPTVQIEGPVTNPAVTADASGALVSLPGYTVAPGELVTIQTAPGSRSVTSPVGGNLIGQVSETSTLTAMFLAPEPLAEDGINTFRLTGADLTDQSSLRVRYHTRKVGLGL
jgi:hypothetical protein